ncbi:restriction endonuclease [Corallococcus macrosporus]|uniref:restriction endonuclease n=1 Tax=Corallococcus macrosporus TaxID=35 RepID=UPI0032430085
MPAPQPRSANFDFLRTHDPLLVALGAQAERYFAEDPTTCLMKLRQFAEVLEESYQELRRRLAEELLERIKACDPRFFEKLVVDLLVTMGYGGSRKDAGQAVGQSGDEGIDGIIKEDRLGLDVVYIQAKRWNNTVGRPVVQAFAGSLEGQRARKGVLITTSDFSREARDYVKHIEKKIVLIDGEELAKLMIDSGVGVTEVATYTVKRLDLDYFGDEE